MTSNPVRILLIENNSEHVDNLLRLLDNQQNEYYIETANSFNQADDFIKNNLYTIALSRHSMPDGNLIDFLSTYNNKLPFPFLIIPEPPDQKTALETIDAGAFYYKTEMNEFLQKIPEFIERCINEWRYIEQLKEIKVEQIQSKAALSETEQKYSMLVEKSKDGIVIIQDDMFKFANAAASQISGYTTEELLDRQILSIISEEYKEFSSQILDALLLGNEIINDFEIKIVCKNSLKKDIVISWSPIQYMNRAAVLGIIHDITKRKIIETALLESEEKYRTLQENLPVGLFQTTEDGKITYANPASFNIFGYESFEDFYKTNIASLYIDPQDRKTLIDKIKSGGSVNNYEVQMKRKDGTEIWVSTSVKAIFGSDGKIKFMDGFCKNITGQKNSEITLKQSEELYSALFQNNPIQTVVVDKSGKIIEFNKAKQISGDRIPQIGSIMYKDYAGNHRNDMYKELMECISKSEMREYPEQIYKGKVLSVKISPFEEGAIIISQDITQQKIAEEELIKNELKFRFITENMLDLVSMCDIEGRFTFISPSHESILGYNSNEMLGIKFYDNVHPEDLDYVINTFTPLNISPKQELAIYRYRHSNGNYIWMETYGNGIFNTDKQHMGTIFCSRNVTSRKDAEKRIEHLNELLYAIRNVDQLIAHEKNTERLMQRICDCLIQTRGHTNVWIACTDSANDIIFAAAPSFKNKCTAFIKMQKNFNNLKCWDSIKHNSGLLILDDTGICGDCRLSDEDHNAGRVVIKLEYDNRIYGLLNVGVLHEFIHEEQERSLLEEVAGEIAFGLYNNELEKERKELQKQLYRSARLSAVGQLAAGIAHEFNNMLSVILGHTQLSLEEDAIEEIKKSLKEIEKTTKRGSGIVAKLAAFAKPKEPDFKSEHIGKIIDEVILLQKKQLQLNSITMETKYNTISKISMDRGQIEQVFLNLLINSIHAIKPKGRGKIIISAIDINGNVEIRFSDNGIGMDKDIKTKIFDPFFTTKGAWAKDDLGISGTGLGLSISHSIIKQHNGTITVKSQKNKGTTFIIDLPIDTANLIAEETPVYKISKPDLEKMKKMRILLVDDEYEMTNIFEHIFDKAGFQNFKTENNGEKALSTFKEFKPDIVFLDIIMPEMDGEKILKKLKILNVKIPVVFMSGKVDSEKNTYIKNGAFDYIQKPFEINEIYNILNKIKPNESYK